MTGNTGEQDRPAFKLYYSYAQTDEALCRELEKHLRQLERHNLVKSWHRGMIPVGTDTTQETALHLQDADVILLLISPDYLDSDDCYAEMQWALKREQVGKVRMIPVILRPVQTDYIPIHPEQLLPRKGRPVTTWPSWDEAFQDILLGIRTLLEQKVPLQHEYTNTLMWNVPIRNPFFTGREHLLQQLYDNLNNHKVAALIQPYLQQSQQAQAISGLGGIGKTQAAVEYAYRHRYEYRYILWVPAATRDAIVTSFIELATLLKLLEQKEQDQNIIIRAIKSWFTTHDGWLLVFDNVDDLSIMEEFLPPDSRGHIVLTTRAQAPGALANSLEVEQMDMQDATLLLLRRARVLQHDDTLEQASGTDHVDAEAIAREMDGLPLALDQAGAYIEETQCSLTSYLNQYRQRQHALLERRGGTGKQRPKSVATTWSLSFEQVEKLNPIAADLLRFLAFLAPDTIPEQLIRDGAPELGPTLQPLADDESVLDEAVAALARYSLARRKREDATITVHRLVQAVLKNTMSSQTQRQWAEYTVRAVNRAFPDAEDYRNWQRCQQFLSHTQVCVTLIDQWQLAFSEAGWLCNQVGYYLQDRAQYAEAEAFYLHAIAINEQSLGLEHPDLAICLNNLAMLYKTQSKYQEAEPLLRRAIVIGEQTLGPEHPDLATRLNNLASLYTNQGRYKEAEQLLQRAIGIGELTLGQEHPDLAIRLNNLANLYWRQDKYEEAEPLYQRAITIGEQMLGLEHPDLATWLNNLANLYTDQSKYEEAEPLYRRAISIGEKALGSEHPDLATRLNNLALLYTNQGRYKEAEPLYRRAMAIDEQVLGTEHPSLGRDLNNLALLYTNQGRYEEAEPLYQRAIAINEQVLGPLHFQTITVHGNYKAYLWLRNGKDAM